MRSEITSVLGAGEVSAWEGEPRRIHPLTHIAPRPLAWAERLVGSF